MEATTDRMASDYANLRPLVLWLVRRHLWLYGGDPEEALGEANLAFVHAWRSWKPELSSLRTWVRNCVTTGMLESRRTFLRRQGLHREVPLPARFSDGREETVVEARTDAVEEVLAQLSDDARSVGRMALLQSGTPKQRRRATIKELQRLGWSGRRIVRAFELIRRELT